MKNRKLSIRISDGDWQQVHDKAEQVDMTLTNMSRPVALEIESS